MVMKSWLTGLAVLSLLAGSAMAASIKVSDGDSLQEAIDNAPDGSTLILNGGSYAETITIDGRNNLTIKAKRGAFLDEQNEGGGLRITNSTGISISGLRIQDSGSDGVMMSASSGVSLVKCVIASPGGQGIQLNSCTDVLISRCHVFDTAQNGIDNNGTDGLTVEKTLVEDAGIIGIDGSSDWPGIEDVRLSRNRVFRSGSHGMRVGGTNITAEKNLISESTLAGIAFDSSSTLNTVTVTKNKVLDSATFGINLDRTGGSGISVSKNTVTDSGATGLVVGGSGNTVEKNKVSNAGGRCIEINCDDSTVTANTAANAGDDGIRVNGINNTVTKNKAELCHDASYTETNTYVKNRFGSLVIDPPGGGG